MKKIIILAFAVVLTIITYNYFYVEKQELDVSQKNQTSITYCIKEEQNLIAEESHDANIQKKT